MIRRFSIEHLLALGAAFAIVTVAVLFGGGVSDDGNAIGGLLGMAAARPAFGWNRKRDAMQTFTNVGAGQTAYSIIPRYRRTIFGMVLQLGGTTFPKSYITRLELFLGDKSIWGPVSGAQLDAIDRYLQGPTPGPGRSAYHLPIDFTLPNVKELSGEYIGGLDLSTLPDGILRLEVDISGSASAPTLSGVFTWGAPQAAGQLGPLMNKLTRRTYPQAAAGDFFPEVDLRGSILAREFWFHDVATAAVTAAQAEGVANTGNGAMGAVSVTAYTPTGRRKLRMIEPAANAGRFAIFGPTGEVEGTGTVAVAYSANGLAFTLADDTDFVAGDGFTIDVLPLNTDQNLNLVEIKKNDETWFYRTDRAARYEQERFGRQPLSQLFVADLIADNHIDAVLDTLDAATLVHRLNNTSAAILTLVAQTLARPVS